MTLSQQEMDRLRKAGKLPAEGVKFDAGKPALALLPAEAIEEIGRVLEHGSKKYGANNWRRGMAYTQVLGAALRHLFAFLRGEDRDPETGLHHCAHAACGVLFCLTYSLTDTGRDDRWGTKEALK